MADVKLMVMYPRPQDMETFDHLYQDENVPIGDGLSSEYVGTHSRSSIRRSTYR